MTDTTPTARDVIVAALTTRHEELRGEAYPYDFDGAHQILAALGRAGYVVARKEAIERNEHTGWRQRLIAKLTPADKPQADHVKTYLTLDGVVEREGEQDQMTETYLRVGIVGYDEDETNVLWSDTREYEGSRAVEALLDDLDKAGDR